MLTLKYPPFPHPRWFACRGELHSAIVQEDGSVAAWDRLHQVIEGEMPEAGTELLIRACDFHLVAITRAEHDAEIADKAARHQALKAEAHAREQQAMRELEDQAKALNASLHIPVRWTSGYKPVLSGLSENSFGTGTCRSTVAHVLLLEDLEDGRLKRSKGSLLCTSASGSDGKRWVSPEIYSVGANGNYVSQVTCQQCLKVSKRWSSASSWQEPELHIEP